MDVPFLLVYPRIRDHDSQARLLLARHLPLFGLQLSGRALLRCDHHTLGWRARTVRSGVEMLLLILLMLLSACSLFPATDPKCRSCVNFVHISGRAVVGIVFPVVYGVLLPGWTGIHLIYLGGLELGVRVEGLAADHVPEEPMREEPQHDHRVDNHREPGKEILPHGLLVDRFDELHGARGRDERRDHGGSLSLVYPVRWFQETRQTRLGTAEPDQWSLALSLFCGRFLWGPGWKTQIGLQ